MPLRPTRALPFRLIPRIETYPGVVSLVTAAIMSNQISTGFAYQPGRSKWEISYSFHPTAEQHVDQSSLLSGEYNNSTVHVGTQSLTVGYSFRF